LGRGLATTASREAWTAHGWVPQFVGLGSEGELAGGVMILTKRIFHTPWRLARIECLLADPRDLAGSTEALLTEAGRLARRSRALEVEVRPNIPEGLCLGDVDWDGPMRQGLARCGYRPAAARGATYLVKIDLDDEALLNSLGSKCRRDIRRGMREGVTVAERPSEQDFQAFCQAHKEMAMRKGLKELSESDYRVYWALIQRGYLRLFGAQHNGRTCNLALVDALGIPRYLLGAAMPSAYERGVPPTGQVLHYHIMRTLRDRGASFYDLGGSPGPLPQEGHPNYTVWRFKHEFGAPYVYMIPYNRQASGPLGGLAMRLARKMGYVRP
jgi:hypothetical protein